MKYSDRGIQPALYAITFTGPVFKETRHSLFGTFDDKVVFVALQRRGLLSESGETEVKEIAKSSLQQVKIKT
jgi:hypothetical protein